MGPLLVTRTSEDTRVVEWLSEKRQPQDCRDLEKCEIVLDDNGDGLLTIYY